MADERDSAIEGDPALLERVTEGLRAGPGTVAWEEALRAAGASRGAVASEMEALARVRRRLEAGRAAGWREVSAGEGFTRKLMGQIDRGGGPERRTPTVTTWLVAGAIAVGTGAIGWGVWGVLRGGDVREGRPAGVSGSATGTGGTPGAGEGGVIGEGAVGGGTGVVAYSTPRVVWDFGRPWPGRTRLVGALPTRSSGEGWRPAEGAGGGSEARGASSLLEVPLPEMAGNGGAVVVELAAVLPRQAGSDAAGRVVLHLFVTDSAELDERFGMAEAEWHVELTAARGDVRVVSPDLTVDASDLPAAATGPVEGIGGETTLRLRIAGDSAELEAGGEVLWRGALGLGGAARYVGVRFVGKGNLAEGEVPVVRRVRVFGGG